MIKRIPNPDLFKFSIKPVDKHAGDSPVLGATPDKEGAWHVAERLNYLYNIPYVICDADNKVIGVCDAYSV
jgi:hypothetical protein